MDVLEQFFVDSARMVSAGSLVGYTKISCSIPFFISSNLKKNNNSNEVNGQVYAHFWGVIQYEIKVELEVT